MDDLRFSVILYSISVISNRWVGDDEKLWTIKPPRLRLKRFPPPADLESPVDPLRVEAKASDFLPVRTEALTSRAIDG